MWKSFSLSQSMKCSSVYANYTKIIEVSKRIPNIFILISIQQIQIKKTLINKTDLVPFQMGLKGQSKRKQKVIYTHNNKLIVKVAQSCPTVCDPMNYTVLGLLQARILEWVAISFSRGSSQPSDRSQVSCIAGRFFTR